MIEGTRDLDRPSEPGFSVESTSSRRKKNKGLLTDPRPISLSIFVVSNSAKKAAFIFFWDKLPSVTSALIESICCESLSLGDLARTVEERLTFVNIRPRTGLIVYQHAKRLTEKSSLRLISPSIVALHWFLNLDRFEVNTLPSIRRRSLLNVFQRVSYGPCSRLVLSSLRDVREL